MKPVDRHLTRSGSQAPQDRFSSETMQTLLTQFEGTGPEDPAAAADYCADLEAWLASPEADRSIPPANLDRLLADLWFMQGMLCHLQGHLEAAIELLQRSIDRSQDIGHTNRQIHGLRSIAMTFEQAGMQADSTRCIFEALDLAEQHSDPLTLALVSHALTSLYQSQGAYDQMLESAMRTRQLAETIKDRSLLIRSYGAISVAYAHLKDPDPGFHWIDRALELASDGSQPLALVYLNLNRVFLLRHAGRFREAVEVAEGQLDAIQKLAANHAATISVTIAEVYLAAGNLPRAEQMLERAKQAGRDGQVTTHLINYYETAAALFEAKGDPASALDMMQRRHRLGAETRGREAQARLVALERRFASELAAKADEIHHLRTVELVEKNHQLSDLIHQRDEILQVVVHDLRNPLAATQMLGDSLLSELSGTIDEEVREQLESIQRAATEMRKTIDSLLASQRTETVSNPTPASTAVRLAIAQATPIAAERRVSFEAVVDDTELIVDSALLRRALEDLLFNAVGSATEGSVIDVLLTQTDRGARITMRGSGLAFDGQASGGRSLYIARRLIERMNGSLTIAPSLNKQGQSATVDLRS